MVWNVVLGAAIRIAPKVISKLGDKFPMVAKWTDSASKLPVVGTVMKWIGANPNKAAFGAGFLTTEGSVWEKAQGGMSATAGSMLLGSGTLSKLTAALGLWAMPSHLR